MVEAHFAVPAAGGILVADQHAAQRGRGRLHPPPLRRALPLRRRGASGVDRRRSICPASPSSASTTPGSPAIPTRTSSPAALRSPVAPSLADEEETISINYTSGTTGPPKGVQWTHRGAYLHALGNVIETGLTAESVFLWTVPMFTANGWCFPWAVVAVAGTQVCLRKVDLASSGSSSTPTGSPTTTARPPSISPSPTTPPRTGSPPRHRRHWRRAALADAARPAARAQLPADPHLRSDRDLAPATVCAWQPEWATLSDDEQAERLARQGQGRVVAEPVRVVDEAMRDVPRDGQTMGEVVMRGNMVMKGYYDDPEATAEAFRGGWFHSGDLAVMHPDGDIELRDRKKDIIISGGENISTIEVEQVLCRHPAVLECAVVAIPDEHWGERPKAFVTLKPGETATADEIIAFCREHLAHFKCPAAVAFGELPKTSTGKVQKNVLRERSDDLSPA